MARQRSMRRDIERLLPATREGPRRFDGADVGDTFLQLPPGTTKEQWAQVAERVTEIGQGYHWWLADLAAYALHAFADGKQTILELAARAGIRRAHMRMLARVGASFPVPQRVRGLTIFHHLAVVRLTPGRRAQLLAMAVRRNWPARVLHDYVRPPDERTVLAYIRVPARVGRSNNFQRALRDFAARWQGRSYLVGMARPAAAISRGPRRHPIQRKEAIRPDSK